MAEFLQSEALSSLSGIRHGFFTRKGGVSEGIYASLNVGPGSDDVAEHVVENRHRVAEAMGVIPERLCSLYQIHSDKVVTLRGPFDEGEKPEGDAMVTNIRGLALGILTADCAPVLFADETAKVIGVAHAGWPGALIDIPSRTVEAMERLGAKREQIIAVIGPCIHQESYEVDAGFRERFMQQSPENSRFFVQNPAKNTHFLFDLPGYVAYRLQLSGVENLHILPQDTYAEEALFFSNRRRFHRDEPDYGRQVSVISLT